MYNGRSAFMKFRGYSVKDINAISVVTQLNALQLPEFHQVGTGNSPSLPHTNKLLMHVYGETDYSPHATVTLGYNFLLYLGVRTNTGDTHWDRLIRTEKAYWTNVSKRLNGEGREYRLVLNGWGEL